MRFFASWWERFPKREAAPTLLAVLFVPVSIHMADGIVRMLAGLTGFGWS